METHFSLPKTGVCSELWFDLSWDETCVDGLSTASANRFNAPLYWWVIKKSQKAESVERKPNT